MRASLGLDFGTESVRALAVDVDTGAELAEAVSAYRHGVISQALPGGDVPLPPDFALQHAGDYEQSMLEVIRAVLQNVPAMDIIGVGIDFTACTILPIHRDGTPLMFDPRLAGHPHAWVKLWKHHAAQPQADRINELARSRNEPFLQYYSGAISSEWMLPKCWEILENASDVYHAADLIVDAGDWIVYLMTGMMCRNACAAGYKGLWNAELGFPSQEFLFALDPGLRELPAKWLRNIVPPGLRAGTVTRTFAEKSGLRAGTPVSAATIDAHSGVPGMGVFDEGPMSIIMGTSSCHMVLSRELKLFNGYAGVAKDGIIPGYYGYESGQSAVGDVFAWFARDFIGAKGRNPFSVLSKKAALLRPGEGGVVALDWLNGNRSVLMNANLSGMIAGLTLSTRPEHVYRALVEATAFGTKIIVDAYRNNAVPVTELVVCGGLAKDPFIMQVYADVTGLPVRVAASGQAVALGSAIFGAMAAGFAGGGYDHMHQAVKKMTRRPRKRYEPNAQYRAVYDELFSIYLQCHDYFGKEHPELMRKMKKLNHE
jgi:L-ribulokinase